MNKLKKYEGELDNVDPFNYGIELREKEQSCYEEEYDPTDRLIGGRDDDPVWEFLNRFREQMIKGWYSEDRKLKKEQYFSQLPAFKENIPELNQECYIETPNNVGVYHKVRVEFIPVERDNVVVRYLESDAEYSQSKINVVGYSYPGKFVKFYNEIPK
jgi:hypothetical protein